ncbi:CBO0543 family protein [Shouchella shacheensis]|uniref:CBO0543 family protein n=1 Tax=Shouchella shacheensis TaxID=1649580 RepID=UPI00073FE77F|nr:CBO0543 family protein [Shouchella shacheensis]
MQPTWQDVTRFTQQFRDAKMEYWLNENVCSFSWWLLLGTTIGSVVVWLIILDKKRIVEIVMYGFFIATTAIMADVVGVWLGLWHYPTTLTPVALTVEIHKVQMPIIYMMIYQYFRTWKAFILASTVNAVVFSFLLEPLLIRLQIYETYHWKHLYSFFPYILIAVAFKYILHRLKQLDKHYD